MQNLQIKDDIFDWNGDAEILRKANYKIKLLNQAKDLHLTSGRNPQGISAAVIYIAATLTNERKTQKAVAEIATVTDVTIRSRYKELLNKLLIEISL